MKVDYIHGVSHTKYSIEADQRSELTSYQRRHKNREVIKVDIPPAQETGRYWQWTIKVEYKEKQS